MNNENRKRAEEDLISIIRADLAHQKEYRPSSNEPFRSEGYIRSIMHIEEYFKEMQEETEEGKEVLCNDLVGPHCRICGRSLSRQVRHCHNCGQKLIWPNDSEKEKANNV